MKIAEDRGDGKRISEYCKAVVEEKDDKVCFSWNLSSDVDYEQFPKEVVTCLKHAQIMQRDYPLIFPKFEGFYRSGMIVTVEVSTNPV